MRMLLRVSIPVDTGNAASKAGTIGSTIEKIVSDLTVCGENVQVNVGIRTGPSRIVIGDCHSWHGKSVPCPSSH
jgi:hypothetical protein